jgi:hypothetical protein
VPVIKVLAVIYVGLPFDNWILITDIEGIYLNSKLNLYNIPSQGRYLPFDSKYILQNGEYTVGSNS